MPIAKKHVLTFSPNEERIARGAGRGRSAAVGVRLVLRYVLETWPQFVQWAHARKEWVSTDAPMQLWDED